MRNRTTFSSHKAKATINHTIMNSPCKPRMRTSLILQLSAHLNTWRTASVPTSIIARGQNLASLGKTLWVIMNSFSIMDPITTRITIIMTAYKETKDLREGIIMKKKITKHRDLLSQTLGARGLQVFKEYALMTIRLVIIRISIRRSIASRLTLLTMMKWGKPIKDICLSTLIKKRRIQGTKIYQFRGRILSIRIRSQALNFCLHLRVLI